MSAPPIKLPRKIYFNKTTRQPNVTVWQDDEDHIGFEVKDNDPYHFLELKEDLSGWQYNTPAMEQRKVTAQALREVRERYLIKTDYVPGSPESEKKQKLLKYRQWLRDLPFLVMCGHYEPTPCINLEFDETVEYPIPQPPI